MKKKTLALFLKKQNNLSKVLEKGSKWIEILEKIFQEVFRSGLLTKSKNFDRNKMKLIIMVETQKTADFFHQTNKTSSLTTL